LLSEEEDITLGFAGLVKVDQDLQPDVHTHTRIAVNDITYPLSNSMLHMKVPIGVSGTAKFTFEGLVDTGGCSNFAQLAYVKCIVKKFPNLVKQFCSLAECKMEDIKIGGIGGKIQSFTSLNFGCRTRLRTTKHV
jgi:hypothetical protein